RCGQEPPRALSRAVVKSAVKSVAQELRSEPGQELPRAVKSAVKSGWQERRVISAAKSEGKSASRARARARLMSGCAATARSSRRERVWGGTSATTEAELKATVLQLEKEKASLVSQNELLVLQLAAAGGGASGGGDGGRAAPTEPARAAATGGGAKPCACHYVWQQLSRTEAERDEALRREQLLRAGGEARDSDVENAMLSECSRLRSQLHNAMQLLQASNAGEGGRVSSEDIAAVKAREAALRSSMHQ
ncbi:hypothetical protein CYMTET_33208, partial [Cymbomonas tetramitiformis]